MILTIDVGGTKTLILPFKDGYPDYPDKFPTEHDETAFVKTLKEHLQKYEKPTAVSFAIPGIVQNIYTSSPVFKLGNLPWDSPEPLINCIKELFDVRPTFINDADAATLYEASLHPESEKLIYLTFSTGIGGGIASFGKLLPESATFEPGHTHYVHDNKDLEWEDIASAEAIHKAYHRYVTDFKESDEKALKDIASRIALGLNLIIAEKHPSDIIIGGPLASVFHLVEPYLMPLLDEKPHFEPFSTNYSVNFGCHLYAKDYHI